MRLAPPTYDGWEPRHYQLPIWNYLRRNGKRAVLLWPRRHGKDDVALRWTANAVLERPGAYWHMLPLATQARKAIWDAVDPHTGRKRIDQAFPAAMRESTRDVDMFIRFINGSTWQVVGSDHYDNLVGTSPAGIVYSEWALSNPNAWTYLSPILEENGGWAIFVTTPRGENHATSMYDFAKRTPTWFAEHLTARDCSVFAPDQLDRIRDEMIDLLGEDEGDAKFRQEYLCDRTAATPGAYYAKLIQRALDEGRICDLPHKPGFPVHTAWDLGVADSTVIWFFQYVGGMIHVIDFYEAQGEGAAHYVEVVTSKLKVFDKPDIADIERRLASARLAKSNSALTLELEEQLDKAKSHKGWLWGDHVVPHDARVRDWSTGIPRISVLEELGLHATVQGTCSLTEAGYRADGIDQVRRTLPLCRFDATRCKRGIDALRSYHRQWDDVRKVYGKNPEHDWSSHAADAFRVLAMHRPVTKAKPRAVNHRSTSAWAC